jgi:lactoylglutathione lyase
MRFGHIAMRTKNTREMLDYYAKGFGFKEAFRIMNDDGTLRIVYLHISDGQYLELFLGGEERPTFDDKKSVGARHICFAVDDIEKTKKELEKRGVVFDSEILNMKDNNLSAFLFDPDGNKLEIVQVQNESPHYKFEKSLKI